MNIEEIKAREKAMLGMLEMKCGNCRHFPEGMRPSEGHDCYPESELEPIHAWESAIPGIDIECTVFRYRWLKAFVEDHVALIAEAEAIHAKLTAIRRAAAPIVARVESRWPPWTFAAFLTDCVQAEFETLMAAIE